MSDKNVKRIKNMEHYVGYTLTYDVNLVFGCFEDSNLF